MSAKNATTSNREKLLMALTGVMLLVISIPLLNYLYGPSMTTLQNQNAAVKKQIEEQQTKISMADRATKELEVLMKSSLPEDNDKAVSLYKNRLLELIEKVEFEKWQIDPTLPRSIREARTVGGVSEDQYRYFQFTIRGQGTFAQLGEFLRHFYSVDQLHLIRSITMKPIESAKKLEITLVIEVITIPGTKNTELVTAPSVWAESVPWSAMIRTIAGRNFFAPFVPTPIAEAVPPPEKVDPIPYTYVNAITWLNGKPQVWISLRTEGKKYRLGEGDRFTIGDIDCVVKKIRDRSVEVEAGGVVVAVKLGKSFSEFEDVPDEPEHEEDMSSMENESDDASEYYPDDYMS